MPTATRSLIEAHLKAKSLDGLVISARRKGASWQAIADDIRDLTGVIVSRETLRSWYPQHQVVAKPDGGAPPRRRQPNVPPAVQVGTQSAVEGDGSVEDAPDLSRPARHTPTPPGVVLGRVDREDVA